MVSAELRGKAEHRWTFSYRVSRGGWGKQGKKRKPIKVEVRKTTWLVCVPGVPGGRSVWVKCCKTEVTILFRNAQATKILYGK